MSKHHPRRIVSRADLLRIADISPLQYAAHDKAGTLPAHVMIGARRFYKQSVAEKFAEQIRAERAKARAKKVRAIAERVVRLPDADRVALLQTLIELGALEVPPSSAPSILEGR